MWLVTSLSVYLFPHCKFRAQNLPESFLVSNSRGSSISSPAQIFLLYQVSVQLIFKTLYSSIHPWGLSYRYPVLKPPQVYIDYLKICWSCVLFINLWWRPPLLQTLNLWAFQVQYPCEKIKKFIRGETVMFQNML